MRDKDLLGKPKNPKKNVRATQLTLESEISRKRAQLSNLKKVERVANGESHLLSTTNLTGLTPSAREQLAAVPPIWIPDYDPDLSTEANVAKVSTNPGIQARFLASNEDEVLYTGGRGPLAYGEQVLTPYGFKPIEDINVGDEVVCPDSSTDRVIAIPFDGEDECYEFEFADGRKVIAGQDHKWMIKVPDHTTKVKKRWHIASTKEIIELNRTNNVSIPLSEPTEFDAYPKEVAYPLDPYVLGLLLGDGCLRDGRGRQGSLISVDPQIRDYIIDAYPGVRLDKDGQTIYFKAQHKTKQALIELGVWDKLSNAKFIPRQYLQGPLQIRLAVLQGLMDTDGYANSSTIAEYTSVSEQLAYDVQSLVWSLGGKATISTKIGSYRDKQGHRVYCQKVYRIYINLPWLNIFRLERKASIFIDTFRNTIEPMLRIKQIYSVGVKRCRCITISKAPNLFITTNQVVTKNSGKSDCLLIDPLPQCTNKNFRGLLLRNTMKELRELIKRAKALYPQVYGKNVQWKSQESMFIFPSGAAIEFGYCDKEEDIENYKGQEYTWIGVDELSKFPWPDFVDQLKGSLRSTDPTLKCYFRATTNADGRGKFWIKKRWIDKSSHEVTQLSTFDTPLGEIRTTAKWFHSVPYDNKVLMKTNPQYLANLLNIDNEVLRKQWIENDWEVSSDVAFSEFDSKIHVVEPFKIPSGWYKIAGCDWGYSSQAAVLWAAFSPEGKVYIYREYVTRLETADIFQENVNKLDAHESVQKEVLDGSAWARRGEVGESPGDTMLRLGGRWVPADRSDGSRKASKQLLHQLLNKDLLTEQPGIFIFNTCKEIISQLKTLQLDPNDYEDIDRSKKATIPDHAYDALRYILLSRPPIKHNLFWSNGFGRAETQMVPVSTTFGY